MIFQYLCDNQKCQKLFLQNFYSSCKYIVPILMQNSNLKVRHNYHLDIQWINRNAIAQTNKKIMYKGNTCHYNRAFTHIVINFLFFCYAKIS